MTADLLIGLPVGFAVGLVFFGGLEWTVRRLVSSSRPVLVASVSFLARSALVVAVMLALAPSGTIRVVVALAGFLASRGVLVGRARRLSGADTTGGESWI